MIWFVALGIGAIFVAIALLLTLLHLYIGRQLDAWEDE